MYPPIIVLDGPRGVGKTTLVKNLKGRLENKGIHAEYIPERLDMWTNWCGENVLERAIKVGDNRFFFQILVLHSYTDSLTKAMKSNPEVIILERSPRSAVNVFSEIAVRNGKITAGEFKLISEMTETTFGRPAHVIGLRCSHYPTVRDRVVAREKESDSEWWTRQVYDMYEEYFATLEKSTDFTFIDSSVDKEKVTDAALGIIVNQLCR